MLVSTNQKSEQHARCLSYMMKGSQYLVGLTSYSSSNILIVSSSTIMKFHTPEQEDSKMPAWSVPCSLEVHRLLSDDATGGRFQFNEQELPTPATHPLTWTRSAMGQVSPDPDDDNTPLLGVAWEVDEGIVLKGGHNILLGDYDRANLDRRNIILPFDALICFLDENLVCKYCRKCESKVQCLTVGVATSLSSYCSCGHVASS
jgi:hypothetical protein